MQARPRLARSVCHNERQLRTRVSRSHVRGGWPLRGAICALASACTAMPESTGDVPPRSCDLSSILEFSPAVDEGATEGYSCFYYPLDLGHRSIASIRWQDASAGPIRLHHATLQVTSETWSPSAGTGCDSTTADTIPLHVHAPGGGPLELAPDVGLSLPSWAKYIRIEAHALRTGAGTATPARVEICTHSTEPPNLAGWLGLGAPVPAIRPHMMETSTGRCELFSAYHLIAAWPHMHRVGKEFHATVVRGEVSIPLLDVPNWDFSHQSTYPLDTNLSANDVIVSTCVWENVTADYVLPGPYTSNEMCTFGLIGWPVEAGSCVYASP
jgi:hypothetical protein